MPVVRETNSGLRPIKWIQPMIEWYIEMGVNRGPVFQKVMECGPGKINSAFQSSVD
jgi:hypothetical protein